VLQPSEKKIEESKLVLEGLVQHYKLVSESDKSRTLVELLDNLEFNQVCFLHPVHSLLPWLLSCTHTSTLAPPKSLLHLLWSPLAGLHISVPVCFLMALIPNMSWG
jgi:hypothetical protein